MSSLNERVFNLKACPLVLWVLCTVSNLVQRALVLEDYAPALGVAGLLVGKRVQEVREKKRNKGKIIIVGKMII